MKYVLAVILISLFTITSYNFAGDRLTYNNCMVGAKLDYISKKGAAHIPAQCKAFVLDQIMVK